MKRWGLLAAAALLSIGTALAEEEPSRHIRTTISGEAYAVAVDAGVYGEGQKAVQAYRVTTLDLGKIRRRILILRFGLARMRCWKNENGFHGFLSEGRRCGNWRARRGAFQPIRPVF